MTTPERKKYTQRKCPVHDGCQIISENGGPWKHMDRSETIDFWLGLKETK